MKSKKGQALVEFIIILPILIFILLAVIDYGIISYTKIKLENILVDVGNMYKNEESEEKITEFVKKNDNLLKVNIEEKEQILKIKLYKDYNYITPGLNKIFNIEEISVEREIYNE